MGQAKDHSLTNQLIDYLMGENDGIPKVNTVRNVSAFSFMCFKIRAFDSGFGSVVEQGQFLFSLGLLVLEAVC